jgi:hypothetical protein
LPIKKQQGGISLDSALGAVAQNQYPWTNPDKRVSHRQVLGPSNSWLLFQVSGLPARPALGRLLLPACLSGVGIHRGRTLDRLVGFGTGI